jgi:peptidoglycan DL-endopeptidase CwlO
MSPRPRSRLLAFVLASSVVVLLPARAGANEASRATASRQDPLAAKVVRIEPVAKVELPSRGELAARAAVQQVGIAYHWGGETPANGFDCSGLVRWAYRQVGLDLPHSSYALYDVGRPVAAGKLAPGDILFFAGLGHVGLYVGHGRMVHAPQTGRDVEIVSLGGSSYGASYVAARRVTPS